MPTMALGALPATDVVSVHTSHERSHGPANDVTNWKLTNPYDIKNQLFQSWYRLDAAQWIRELCVQHQCGLVWFDLLGFGSPAIGHQRRSLFLLPILARD